jgi:hypothetical protein
MREYCAGCKRRHEDTNWRLKGYDTKNGTRTGWFCSRWFKPRRFAYESFKCAKIRAEHEKEIAQPFDHGEPSKKFVKMYRDEPDKLERIYSKDQLKKLEK